MVTGFATLGGKTVGIVANNSMVKDGSLDVNACDKHAHFVRTCDCFNVPIVSLVDSVGFTEEAQSPEGLEKHAAKPVFAMCEATVPKIVLYLRKVYGTTRLVMGGRGMKVDSVIAWPTVDFNYGPFPVKEPYNSGAIMAFEEVIDPQDTRSVLIDRLERLSAKMPEAKPWRKHGLIQF